MEALTSCSFLSSVFSILSKRASNWELRAWWYKTAPKTTKAAMMPLRTFPILLKNPNLWSLLVWFGKTLSWVSVIVQSESVKKTTVNVTHSNVTQNSTRRKPKLLVCFKISMFRIIRSWRKKKKNENVGGICRLIALHYGSVIFNMAVKATEIGRFWPNIC